MVREDRDEVHVVDAGRLLGVADEGLPALLSMHLHAPDAHVARVEPGPQRSAVAPGAGLGDLGHRPGGLVDAQPSELLDGLVTEILNTPLIGPVLSGLGITDVAAYVCTQPGATPELPSALLAPFRHHPALRPPGRPGHRVPR